MKNENINIINNYIKRIERANEYCKKGVLSGLEHYQLVNKIIQDLQTELYSLEYEQVKSIEFAHLFM